ncbi:MAG: hypothetical protein K0U37_07070 [Gammaproteobacteria bacterium]|nr:hypothetical protein [Gammaproteobacteria bacterium]
MHERFETSLSFFNETSDYESYGPEQIEPNVFVGRSIAASGEPVYLRMELVTEENESHWRQYQAYSKMMSEGNGRSILPYLTYFIKASLVGDDQVRYTFQDGSGRSYIEESGLSVEEFAQFITHLGENGFTSKTRKSAALAENSSGSNHMSISSLSGSSYIIFASKTPDFLIQEVSVIEPSSSIKAFKSEYDNLLMTVGSDFSCPTSFHNRGISRNPLSVIDGTHKGLAMILHGFTAAVAKRFFPSKLHMRVKPVGAMQHLICTSFKPEEVTIEGGIFTQVAEKAKGTMEDPRSSYESGLNTIDISALVELYYDKSRLLDVSSGYDSDQQYVSI